MKKSGFIICAAFLYFLLLPLPLFCVSEPEFGRKDGELSLAAVQLEISIGDYLSEEAFWMNIDSILEDIFSRGRPDLIVFPEYTGVFYSLIPYLDEISGAADFETAVLELSRKLGGASIPGDLFFLETETTDRYMAGWSERAETFSVNILPGTVFYPAEGPFKELRNRALVFDSEGDLLYTQDKVYLTDFEKDICHLSPGSLSDASGFEIEGRRIYLTICRDTFFPAWEDVYAEPAFLWIDIKANGAAFDAEQQAGFLRALPSRLPKVPVDYGLTLCLTGDFLDLFWEGESSLIENSSGECVFITRSENPRTGEILFLNID